MSLPISGESGMYATMLMIPMTPPWAPIIIPLGFRTYLYTLGIRGLLKVDNDLNLNQIEASTNQVLQERGS